MFPDFSYILHFIFGTEPDNAFSIIKTFGLFLAVAFLASAYILSLEMKRKTKEGIFKPVYVKTIEGEPPTLSFIIWQAGFGFIIGFKLVYIIQNFDTFQADAAGILLSLIGSVPGGIIGAIVIGGFHYFQKKKQALLKPIEKQVEVQPYQLVGDITIIAAISGLIGAKLFAIFESADTIRYFLKDPIGQLFSGTGLAIYGGLIVAFITVLMYIRKKGFDSWHMMDVTAPAIITGYAVGRIGCQMSGDGDWGIANTIDKPSWLSWLPDKLWIQHYPHNVINEGIPIPDCTWNYCHQLDPGVFPTPVYETILGFVILGILWSLRKRIQIPGILFFIYMILNGIERYFIEKIRVNDKIHLMNMELTQAEIISVLFVIVGIIGIIWRVNSWKTKHKLPPI
jgi:phosphatidylglycerol---prolipoprotein diacylglyceryl transferase